MFTLDFNEPPSDDHEKISVEDRKFIELLKAGITQRSDGHFEMPLPLKSENILLPNNKQMALSRLMKLKYKLGKDQKYAHDYRDFMKKLIDNGHAEVASDPPPEGRTWYIPHHGIYHPRKPNKIRVVFDCSAEYKEESLNRNLLQGPDMTNNLTGILCRFRNQPIAFACDVEGMFHQVHVNKDQRDYLRFLWWEDGDMDQPIKEYRMTVHLFGATSSPGCANFALRSTADKYEQEFGEAAAKFVRDDFYVDDGLKSTNDAKKAIELIASTHNLCAKGGFNLHKFICNDKDVLESIPKEQRASKVQDIDLMHEELPAERTLGIQWCIETDTFFFTADCKEKPTTRRTILSTVSSLYDPLGLLSPFVLVGKRILQDLCRDNVDWDESLSDEMIHRWQKWKRQLQDLSDLHIPRCYIPPGFSQIKTVELHHFADASQLGYGACSYLKIVDEDNQVSTSLVMAKSRVTPTKSITIPRLELTAAVVAAKVANFLKKELKYKDIKEYFWTDSKIVLGYIANESKR